MPKSATKRTARPRGIKVSDDRGCVVRAAYIGRPTAEMNADGRTRLGSLAWGAALGKLRYLLVIMPLLTITALIVPTVVFPLTELQRGIILYGVGVPAIVGIFWMIRRTVAPRFVRELAARGVCGSCFYPLTALRPEGDGCTVCPECGAAWRLPLPPAAPVVTTSTPETDPAS